MPKNFALTRAGFVKKTAIAGGLVMAAPTFIPRRGAAADQIKIGDVDPQTGVFAMNGISQIRGAQMATEHVNARGGVMGRELALVVQDSASDPGVGVQKARQLVNQEGCVALIGTVSSATSLSVSGAANAMGVVFIDSGGHADQVTGSTCHYNTFRTCHSTWMETHATGYTFAEKFGKRWFMITPDYAFGHALSDGYRAIAKTIGATIVKETLTPLGTSEFSSYLTQVLPAKPDMLLVLVQGTDFVNCLKQATAFGITQKVAVGGPQVELESVWALPEEARVGYWGTEWYFKDEIVLGKGNTEGLQFATAYEKKYGSPATMRSAFGYISLTRLAAAINEAKSTETVKIARQLEGQRFKSIFEGDAYYRPVDHQLMYPMWVAKIRPNGTPSNKLDVFDIVDRQPADKIEWTVAEKKMVCNLGYPG